MPDYLLTLLSGLMLLATFNSQAASSETTYYVPDALGSPIAAMDETGNVKWRKHYRPFGEEIEQGESSKDNRIGYTGHVHDRDTGLTYMGARYYDPEIGRFMGMDPVGVDANDPRTFNRYAYGNNSPFNYVDPDGRFAFLAWFATPPGIAALQYTGSALLGIMGGVAVHETVIEPMMNTSDSGTSGKRRKNRIPDKGDPGTVSTNPSGSTKKKYGEDGWVEKEWNKGHGPKAPSEEQEDHIHDWEPNPYHPDGRPTRQPGRKPGVDEDKEFND